MDVSAPVPARLRDLARANERALLAAIVLAQWLVLYNLVNWSTWGRSTVLVIETPVDRAIPLVTPWIFVYSLAYPCCLAPVFLVTIPRLRVACFAYTLAIVSSLFTFTLMPVGILRPDPPPDAVGAALMQLTRTLDAPFNCFPSLHVSLDFLAACFTGTQHRRHGAFLLIMALVISVSTMFVKQHYFLDIVAGALLALLAFRIAMKAPVRRLLGDVDDSGDDPQSLTR
jgi:membrane-associated phospholipid phosphatase